MRLSKHVALTHALAAGSVTGYVFPDCEGGPLASNAICNTALDPITRATSLVKLFTVPELINNTVNRSPGVPRLGLPAYQWWSEALVNDNSLTESRSLPRLTCLCPARSCKQSRC